MNNMVDSILLHVRYTYNEIMLCLWNVVSSEREGWFLREVYLLQLKPSYNHFAVVDL